MLLLTVDSKIIKKDCRKIRLDYERRRLEEMAKMFSMEDWEKTTIKEVKIRWGNRRKELEEVEKRKREIDEKIEIRKKTEEEKRSEREGVLYVEYLGI